MNYKETIDFLYQQLPMFQRDGAKAFKPKLHNVEVLCHYLGDPQKKFKSIHVGGTNGKGSSCHYLAAILQSAGYKVGLYTSPHLKCFTERIKLNGNPITEEKVVDFVQNIKALIPSIKPSFFEITVAMAFDYFAQSKVDIAIIEVGLGGRLDSTNIILPELSLITNIGFDHQQILGDTLEAIAFEKAGIIKKQTPVVISEFQKETQQVFQQVAVNQEAPLYFADQSISHKKEDQHISFVEEKWKITLNFEATLQGNHQIRNLKGVLKCIRLLLEQGWLIGQQEIIMGIEKVRSISGIKGRWHVLDQSPLTICDVAHNEAGIREVLQQIAAIQAHQLFMVLGFVKDKDVKKILSLLPKSAIYIFCEPQLPRAMPANEVAKIAEEVQLKGAVIHNVKEAVKYAKNLAQNQEDLVFVGGSTFVVAEIV